MRAEAVGQLAYALDCLVAALADDVRCAELLSERDPIWMAAEENDLLGPEASGGDHAAQADGAVANDGGGLARTYLGGEGRVVACSHHVREREQRRHQRVVGADRQHDERPVRLRHADGFALSAVDVVETVPAAMEAFALQTLLAEHTGAVGPQERRDDDVSGLDSLDVGANGLDDADELVAHAAAGVAVLHRLVRPEVAAADGGAGDGDERVGGLDQAGVRNSLDANVTRAEHDGCAHGD